MKDDFSRRGFIKAGAGGAIALAGGSQMAKAQTGMMATDDLDAVEFGQSLRGFGINLLVSDVDATVKFSKDILLAEVIHTSDGFAVLKQGHAVWMLHGDETYHSNPLQGFVKDAECRGQGVELRLYDIDPDDAEKRARDAGYTILSGTADKPHGLRECYILDPDGYCWVPSRASD